MGWRDYLDQECSNDGQNGQEVKSGLHSAHNAHFLAKAGARTCRFQWVARDPESFQEMLMERIGILMDSGMFESEAVQEARWQLERTACWDRFHGHARIILQAYNPSRKALLDQYRRDAEAVFGENMAEQMAATMRAWIAREL